MSASVCGKSDTIIPAFLVASVIDAHLNGETVVKVSFPYPSLPNTCPASPSAAVPVVSLFGNTNPALVAPTSVGKLS